MTSFFDRLELVRQIPLSRVRQIHTNICARGAQEPEKVSGWLLISRGLHALRLPVFEEELGASIAGQRRTSGQIFMQPSHT
jgi:hypothetical protein